MPLPSMYRVRQSLHRQRLADIPTGVRTAMAEARLPVKRGDAVAVGAGSRGVANIAVIVRAVVDHLKELGAKPFVFPAMGSHGGATAEGQLEILAHYGITEATMGCPLRASMDVVQAGLASACPSGATGSPPRPIGSVSSTASSRTRTSRAPSSRGSSR